MIFPRNDIAEEELSIETCLILALGAKYGNFRADPSPTEWYAKARVQLFVEPQDDLSLMRTLALICLFEINDDVGKASQILGIIFSLHYATSPLTNTFRCCFVPRSGKWIRRRGSPSTRAKRSRAVSLVASLGDNEVSEHVPYC
jgi:hypothetical protein